MAGWNDVDSRTWTDESLGTYKDMNIPGLDSRLAWGVSLTADGDDVIRRLRVGFYYPSVVVGGRRLVGPSEEMFSRQPGQPSAIHVIEFGWLSGYSDLLTEVEDYAVVVAPDRGFQPCEAILWGAFA